MKNVWVLSVKTSLPEVCWGAENMKTEILAFESFDDVKKALQKKLREYAFNKNAMFDGLGNMIQFERYWNDSWEPEEKAEDCEGFLTKAVLGKVYKTVMAIFAGEEADLLSISDCDHYDDGMIAVALKDGAIKICGYEDGPYNGYDPVISTNMFTMQAEKDYYLYVDDLFGQDESAELYIDLKKVDVQ